MGVTVLMLLSYFLLSGIPPTITDFPSLVPDCGTTGSIVCHVNTGQEEAQDAMIDIIRQSDGVNLNVDMRFSRTRTDSQPDMATLSYSYQHTLNDDGVYMCVVMTTFGSDKRNATIASGKWVLDELFFHVRQRPDQGLCLHLTCVSRSR